MSVGISVQKVDVDGRAGGLVGQLWRNLDEVRRFKLWLDDGTHDDAFLTGLGYVAAEITVLRAAFTDLDKLRLISHAGAVQAATNDFFFNAKKLTGVDYSG
jgi:hypothetical protein